MPKWDVLFVATKLKAVALDADRVRQMLAEGRLTLDDCVREPGEKKWRRLANVPELHPPTTKAEPRPEPTSPDVSATRELPTQKLLDLKTASPLPKGSIGDDDDDWETLTLDQIEEDDADYGVLADEEVDEADYFRSRGRREVDELDLTPMVDMTFLLILFFMLTASYSMQTSIQTPPPQSDDKAAARPMVSLEELEDDRIIVTIERDNSIRVDDEFVPPLELVERIRQEVRDTARNELLINADGDAYNETLVRVYDAASEVGIQRISWARLSEEESGRP